MIAAPTTRHIIKIFLNTTTKVFVTGKPSHELKVVYLIIPNHEPPLTPYTKADIRDGYIIQLESSVYCEPVKYQFFRKQFWCSDVHPNA